MWESKADFAEMLAEAQRVGFAEADPTFDIEGIDTAHKLAIITSLAYGCPPSFHDVHVEGISGVTIRDMEYADELGYVIKLLGISTRTEAGVLQRVHPCMVPKLSTIGRVNGGYNAVIVEGEPVGRVTLEGPGAGAGPTASSVVGDLVDIARGAPYKPFTLPVASLAPLRAAPMDNLECSYYVRLAVLDRPGVLASITGRFRDAGISVQSFLQRSHAPGEPVQIVMTTHRTQERAMNQALHAIGGLDFIAEPPHRIRIEPI
jgi:homoserine dehydrogenase